MYAKQVFKCGICDKEYFNVQDRANCELNCYKKQQEEAKKAAEVKKLAEKAARKKEVDDALDKAMQLRNAYIKDYGCYVYDNNDVHNESNIDNYPSLKELINFLM
jgi:hypothetical protein